MVGHEVELLASEGVSDEMDAYARLLGDAMKGDPILFAARTPSRPSGESSRRFSPVRRPLMSTRREAGAPPKRTDWSPSWGGWHKPQPAVA